MSDVERALRDPSSVFAAPADVLDAQGLSLTDKERILRQWEFDSRELAVAEEENMGGGEESVLDLVLEALARLGREREGVAAAPTKHGGTPS